MLSKTHAVKVLAAAFLCQAWKLAELEKHGRLGLGLRKSSKWYSALVEKVVSQFPVRPSYNQLVEFLESVFNRRGIWGRVRKLQHASLLNLPRQEMVVACRWAKSLDLPVVSTPGDLAEWLRLTPGELDWFADRYRPADHVADGPLRHYRYRHLRKSSGRVRILEVPKPRLMQIQRQILHEILDRIPIHSAAHAYRSGRSIATYVTPHAGQQIVIHLDLQEFFPSVRGSQVFGVFRAVGYPDSVASLLAALCTHRARHDAFASDEPGLFDAATRRLYRERHLPQGAPTSPALANLCAYRMDVRLSGLARRFAANYTRYADDLLFSGGEELHRGEARFVIKAMSIALSMGFAVRTSKLRVMRQSQSQRVANVTLNVRPNIDREEFDRLKAMLFNCARFGPLSQNREKHAHFAEHLQGRIAYISMINPQRGERLKALFDQIDWPKFE